MKGRYWIGRSRKIRGRRELYDGGSKKRASGGTCTSGPLRLMSTLKPRTVRMLAELVRRNPILFSLLKHYVAEVNWRVLKCNWAMMGCLLLKE